MGRGSRRASLIFCDFQDLTKPAVALVGEASIVHPHADEPFIGGIETTVVRGDIMDALDLLLGEDRELDRTCAHIQEVMADKLSRDALVEDVIDDDHRTITHSGIGRQIGDDAWFVRTLAIAIRTHHHVVELWMHLRRLAYELKHQLTRKWGGATKKRDKERVVAAMIMDDFTGDTGNFSIDLVGGMEGVIAFVHRAIIGRGRRIRLVVFMEIIHDEHGMCISAIWLDLDLL